MSEATHTPKYKTLCNRLIGGIPFAASTAIARITALADALEITQDEAAELTALAQKRGTTGATVEERLAAVETHQLEQDEALMELAEMCASLTDATSKGV